MEDGKGDQTHNDRQVKDKTEMITLLVVCMTRNNKPSESNDKIHTVVCSWPSE